MLKRILTALRRLLGLEPPPVVWPTRPLPQIVPPAPVAYPIADLVKGHARAWLYTHQSHEKLPPLSPTLLAWICGLGPARLPLVIACEDWRLARHIAEGDEGSTAIGPFGLPPVPPGPKARAEMAEQAKGGSDRSGKGGPARSVDLAATLAELGYSAGYSSGPRR